jgi:hypothetical protein
MIDKPLKSGDKNPWLMTAGLFVHHFHLSGMVQEEFRSWLRNRTNPDSASHALAGILSLLVVFAACIYEVLKIHFGLLPTAKSPLALSFI